MHRGYIKLWRCSVEDEMYFAEPFTKWQAWQDLLLLANYKDGIIMVRGISISVKVGQVASGERFLSERWKWSRERVRNFLKYLENSQQQISRKPDHKIGIITIVNWYKYQDNQTTKLTQTVPQTVPQTLASDRTTDRTTVNESNIESKPDHRPDHRQKQKPDTPKKGILKNIKKEINKEKYGEFKNVFLTDGDILNLKEKFSDKYSKLIEEGSAWLAAKGKVQKNYYAFLLNWARRDPAKYPENQGALPANEDEEPNDL